MPKQPNKVGRRVPHLFGRVSGSMKVIVDGLWQPPNPLKHVSRKPICGAQTASCLREPHQSVLGSPTHPPQLMGFPEERGRLDRPNLIWRKIVQCTLDMSTIFCIFIGPFVVVDRSGDCSGWPGDLPAIPKNLQSDKNKERPIPRKQLVDMSRVH
jgi:hypothetical protein